MKYEEILSIFTGAMLGDAYGLPYEFKGYEIEEKEKGLLHDWSRRKGGRYYPHRARYSKGTYSDDTQLLLGVARSMAFEYGDEDFEYFSKVEMPIWVDYNIGAGRAVKNAGEILGKCYLWESNKADDYFNAGGNGGLMRIMPIVIKYSSDIETIIRKVYENVIITHGHPRAILGATIYAYYLYLIINKKFSTFEESVELLIKNVSIWGNISRKSDSFDSEYWLRLAERYNFSEVWSSTVSSMLEILEHIPNMVNKDTESILRELGCYSSIKGAGDICALASICLYGKYRGSVVEGISEIGCKFGIDTDTVCSITGALLGGSDTEWLESNKDWLKYLQDYEYVKSLINSVYINGDTGVLLGRGFSNPKVRDKLRDKPVGYKVNANPFGNIEIEREEYCEVYSDSFTCRVIYCKSDIGQEISFKYFTRV